VRQPFIFGIFKANIVFAL